jgi:hypothetical protein
VFQGFESLFQAGSISTGTPRAHASQGQSQSRLPAPPHPTYLPGNTPPPPIVGPPYVLSRGAGGSAHAVPHGGVHRVPHGVNAVMQPGFVHGAGHPPFYHLPGAAHGGMHAVHHPGLSAFSLARPPSPASANVTAAAPGAAHASQSSSK